jgi:hypothetical protein
MTPALWREIGQGGEVDPRRLLPVLTALAVACVAATLVVTLARARPEPRPEPPTRAREVAAPAVPPGPAAILSAWDERRAAAWAEGDLGALRGLYVAGSRAGAADVRLLGHYVERGLTVEGLTTQVLSLEVVRRSPARLVLVVTDRVVGGRAVGRTSSAALPGDHASTRRVVLVRERERWLVAEARDQASAAASTSRTSSSSKS